MTETRKPSAPMKSDSLLDALANNLAVAATALMGLGALMLIASLLLYFLATGWLGRSSGWVAVPGFCILLLGLCYYIYPPGRNLEPKDYARLGFMIFMGLVGMACFLYGLSLPFHARFFATLSGGLEKWRENPWQLVFVALPILGGLAIIMIGLLEGRALERSNATIRRLVYGYNALLSGMLLLAVLLLFNVVSYARVPPFNVLNEPFDWTTSGQYSLSGKTTTFLRNLKTPIQVIAIAPMSYKQVDSLLVACQAVAREKFTYRILSRDHMEDKDLVAKKLRQYFPAQLTDPSGLLVISGTEPDATADFIKNADLFDRPNPRETDPTKPPPFIGENALLRSMTFLAGGKVRARVYFTQGNGELDVNDQTNPMGAGRIYKRLGDGNFEPRALRWKTGMKRFTDDPEFQKDDADLVVIARPNPVAGRLSPDFLEAVRAYLNGEGGRKKGKLFVLEDLLLDDASVVKVTGLEAVLAEYGAKINNDRVVTINGIRDDPLAIVGMMDPNANNPISKAFIDPVSGEAIPFLFRDVRTVEAAPNRNPGSSYQAEPLLEVPMELGIWAETRFDIDVRATVATIRKSQAEQRRVCSPKPLSIAVVVSEGAGEMPRPGRMPTQTPRLAVFGNATWISNQAAANERGASLFSSVLSWLHERGDLGADPKIEGRSLPTYQLKLNTMGDFWRLVLPPGFLMIFATIALGITVWVVRRR